MRARDKEIDTYDPREVKRHRSRYNVKPLFSQEHNAIDDGVISILVNEAMMRNMDSDAEHGMTESKCFCFNALVNFGRDLEPKIIQMNSLIPRSNWDLLSESVKNASLNLIKVAIQQMTKLNGDYLNKTSWIAFELIRIPLNGKNIKVPTLQWHRDPGYFNDLTDETEYYADYTTIFMLTNPRTWKGGHLELQKNGPNRHEKPPIHNRFDKTERIKYEYADIVTFYNKDSRHRVTQIESDVNSQDRIIFTCSIYGTDETKAYHNYYCIQ
jgi:hypothetical protein